MGDDSMCQALMEIMEPQLLLRDDEVRIEGTVETFISVNYRQMVSY